MDYYNTALVNVKDRLIDESKEVNRLMSKLREDKVFSIIESDISANEWEKHRKEVYNEDYSEELKNLEQLYRKYNKYLIEHNISKEDLEVKYTCNKCHDTGYINGNLCQCVYEEVKRLQFVAYPMLKNLKFDYSIYGDRENHFKKIVDMCQRAMSSEKSILSLHGSAGVGKSYISYFIAKQMIEQDKIVEVVNAIRLNKLFLDYHLAPIEKKQSVLASITNCDLLVIDDLGVEQNFNKVTIPYLYELTINRMGKKTFITTNLDLQGIGEKYEQRILSRIMDKQNSINYQITGKDLRLV